MTYDNGTAFDIYDAQQSDWLKTRPICDGCGEPIQEDSYFDFNGTKLCEQCVEEYRRWTD